MAAPEHGRGRWATLVHQLLEHLTVLKLHIGRRWQREIAKDRLQARRCPAIMHA